MRRAACAISRSQGPSATACAADARLKINAAASSAVLNIGIMNLGECNAFGNGPLGLLLAARLATLRAGPTLGQALAAALIWCALTWWRRVGAGSCRNGGGS